MAGLQREIIRWLQSLDLTWQIKNAKWDIANGYLVAEIFSWYYPQAIQMHYFTNGKSLNAKLLNWSLLKGFIKRYNIDIPIEYAEGTMHCKEGAATLLIEKLYEILTNRTIRKKEGHDIDFTDRAYQNKLPMHARTTASMAVKNNLKSTELDAIMNVMTNQHKAHDVIRQHVDQRRVDRLQDPQRFGIKPTIGERAERRPPPKSAVYEETSNPQIIASRAALTRSPVKSGSSRKTTTPQRESADGQREETIHDDEIPEVLVKQMVTSNGTGIAAGM